MFVQIDVEIGYKEYLNIYSCEWQPISSYWYDKQTLAQGLDEYSFKKLEFICGEANFQHLQSKPRSDARSDAY